MQGLGGNGDVASSPYIPSPCHSLWSMHPTAVITDCLPCCADFPDVPRNVSVRYKSSTVICLDVQPPADDGGEQIIGYRVDYDQGKVLEFQIGMFTQADTLLWHLCLNMFLFSAIFCMLDNVLVYVLETVEVGDSADNQSDSI